MESMNLQSLSIGNAGKRNVFLKCMELLDRAIQQVKLRAQGWTTMLRERPRKMLNHRAKTPRDLEVFRAIKTDFAESHFHKIFPVWGVKNHPQLTDASKISSQCSCRWPTTLSKR